MKPLRRLGRHLSFANVVACLALFVALGGGAYAASKTLNGKYIVKHSIGANKLKNGTITSKQIKKNSLDSSVIDLSTLTTVPSAQTAVSATSATTATSADSAATAAQATSAETANRATTAASAESAGHANSAGHADSADTATSAGHADSADTATDSTHATTAGDAATLGGKTATELTDACPAETEPFGGICWDENEQLAVRWFQAIKECSAREGRLPTIGELIAYVLQPGIQAGGEVWSADISEVEAGGKEIVITSDDTTRNRIDATSLATLPYRCVFYRTNG